MNLGRVVRVNKGFYKIFFNKKEIKAKVSGRFKYIVTGSADYPSIGDYVIFDYTGELGIIHKVCTRYSELSRVEAGPTNNQQVLASNIDLVFICVSLNNDFNLLKLNRFLSIVYGSNAKPIILLTKSDLTESSDQFIEKVSKIDDKLETYAISAFNTMDLKMMKDIIKNKTSVFLGSSGVGKSTLVNKLIGSDLLEISEIRESDSQGRHTTAHREMFFIEDLNAAIIDTPGIRKAHSYFTDDLDIHYTDIVEFSKSCKFIDCKHEEEPNCGVQNAVRDGRLTAERFDSYKKSLKVNEYYLRKEKSRLRKSK